MNADRSDGDGNGDTTPDLADLFAQLDEVKQQRNELQAALAECRRENRELRKRLGEDES